MAFRPVTAAPPMLNLLATLVVTALPAPAGAVSACAAPAPASADVAVGECEPAPLDLWYRMSRFAEVDPGAVGAGSGPARRLHATPTLASCDAPKAPAQISPPQAPPLALFALPALQLVQVPPYFDADAHALPARALAPPERPPRA